MREVAGYLPGLDPDSVAWRTLAFGRGGTDLEVAVPELTPAQVAALAERVRAHARSVLKTMPVAEVVTAVDAAVARLLDRDDPWRRRAERLLPLVTGYDAEMVRHGLTSYLKTFRKPELLRFLAEDFANPGVLDDFQPVPKGGFARAFGPDLLLHVWAGNVPGLPLWSLVCGLLVKAGGVGKVPSAEPLFAGWFARLLAEVEPRLAGCLAVVWWKGGDAEREAEWLRRADTVLAYGSTASLEALRARVPVTTRFLPYGHKISFALVSHAALDPHTVRATARGVAHDVARWDQQGCYSPHVVYVERGGGVDPRGFARHLAHELACQAIRFPRRALDPGDAGGVAAWRHAEEMQGVADPARELLADPAGAWAVAYADRPQPLAPCGLNRTVTVVAVDRLDDALPCVAPFRPLLQTAAVAAPPRELFRIAGLLGAAGVTRVCAPGAMAAPEAGWHHDGRFNLSDLVAMAEIDRGAELAADALAPYRD
ncbi:acyl-CoA reductase [Azospirillum halopraeferens]|uniref:acyl-CoA reductase n=1 Tax=Azospirillum halopraeferens TaxID=34010 RepID=UPI00040A9930|nr:acyl-CoA reductase [Azospirillum halopraeferens]